MTRNILLILGIVFISCNSQNKSSKKVENKTEVKSIVQRKLENNEEASINNCLIGFKSFLSDFSIDSLKQMKKVKFPLKYSYYEDSVSDDITTENLIKEDFTFIDFSKDKEAINRETDKFAVEIEELKNCDFLYKRIGYDNGIRETYKFKKEKNSWLLVEITDEST